MVLLLLYLCIPLKKCKSLQSQYLVVSCDIIATTGIVYSFAYYYQVPSAKGWLLYLQSTPGRGVLLWARSSQYPAVSASQTKRALSIQCSIFVVFDAYREASRPTSVFTWH